jgi:hypothetical protein
MSARAVVAALPAAAGVSRDPPVDGSAGTR